jgi:hypothetical protein
VVAQLSKQPLRRSDLALCGEPARVSEQLRALEHAGALARRSGRLELYEPTAHGELLDRLDRIAASLHMRAFERALRSLFDPAVRAREGMLYANPPPPARSSENPAASKALNYARAAYARARLRG